MALSTEQFLEKIKNLMDNFSNELDIVLLQLSEDTKDSIVQRIQQKGLNFNNAPFEDYTTIYKAVKQRMGKYSGKVDLTLSGEMWRSTGTIKTGENQDGNFVTVGGRDKETQDKINFNSKLRGDILDITEDEFKYITETFDEELENIIAKYLDE